MLTRHFLIALRTHFINNGLAIIGVLLFLLAFEVGLMRALALWWFARYHYGPWEWLWRSATYLSTDIAWKRLST